MLESDQNVFFCRSIIIPVIGRVVGGHKFRIMPPNFYRFG